MKEEIEIIQRVSGVALGLIILYFLMIMPRVGSRRRMKAYLGKFFAHRGLFDKNKGIPENSLLAFRRAVDAGFGIEMDVRVTKDGVPVVFHDLSLERMCGVSGKVCDFTMEELGEFRLDGTDERIPRFEEVLKCVDGKVPLIVEIKVDFMDLSVCRAAYEVLKDYRGAYMIESFHTLAVRWFRRQCPGVFCGQLSSALVSERAGVRAADFLVEHLMLNFLAHPDFVAYNCKYSGRWERRLCRKLYDNTAVAWTVKSEEQLKSIRKKFDIYIFDSFVPKV